MQGQVVVVTGANAGVGRAAARAFAEGGAGWVALLARDRARLDETAAEVEALGARALVVEVDMADAAAVERAAERVEQEAGPIAVWVNNAMAPWRGGYCHAAGTNAEERNACLCVWSDPC